MFEDRENDIIQQSDLFPNLVNEGYIRSYGLFVESLNSLKSMLRSDYMLRDYTIAHNYTILRVDASSLEDIGTEILTHELPEFKEDISGWISFKFYYDNKGSLVYKTSDDSIGLGVFEEEDHDHDHNENNEYYDFED